MVVFAIQINGQHLIMEKFVILNLHRVVFVK